MLLAQAQPAQNQPQNQPQLHHWKDDKGKVHITNDPPPPGVEVLDPPPPPAMELGKKVDFKSLQQKPANPGQEPSLNPAQAEAWKALDAALGVARSKGETRILAEVSDSLIHDSLWGKPLFLMPLLPVLSLLLLVLTGWWVALGLQPSHRLPVMAVSTVVGLLFSHLLLSHFLYWPQYQRLQANLTQLEHHLGGGKQVSELNKIKLLQCYQALLEASQPGHAPWIFPREVDALRVTMRSVMVNPDPETSTQPGQGDKQQGR